MSLVETSYQHIVIDSDQVAIIGGTNLKVVELVTEHLAYGWSPEELHLQHPYLSLGQIHSALAYYWDHQEELERDIKRRLAKVDRLRRQIETPPLMKRLKEQKAGQVR